MILISDTHAGYKYGLVPPQWRISGAEKVDATAKFQRYLWSCWTHFTEHCEPAEVLILNGDAIHGEDRKDHAVNVISTDPWEQAQMAIELLTPLRTKVERFWLLKGTAYHEGLASEVVEWIGKELDAQQWEAGRHSGYSLYLKWHGLNFSISHHITKSFLYLAGGADRTALLHQSAVAQGKLPATNVIIRSHLHTQRIVWARGQWVINTPAWTVVSPYAAKVMESARAHEASEIGGIILTTDGRGHLGFDLQNYKPYQEQVREA